MRRYKTAIGTAGVLSAALLLAACSNESTTSPEPGGQATAAEALESIDVSTFEPEPGGQATAAEAIAALLHFNARSDLDNACSVVLTTDIVPASETSEESAAVKPPHTCKDRLQHERYAIDGIIERGDEPVYRVDGVPEKVVVEEPDVTTVDRLTLWGQPTRACTDPACADGVRYDYAVAGVEGAAVAQDGFAWPTLSAYYAVLNPDDNLWYVLVA